MSWRIRGSTSSRATATRSALPPHRRRAGRALDARRLHGRALVADRGGRGRRRRPVRPAGRDGGALHRRRAGLAVDVDPVPRRAGDRRAARGPRGDLHRPARRRRDDHFPWAWKDSELVGVRPVAIDVDHTSRRQRLRIRDRVSVRIRDRYAGEETVSCMIPGHDRGGEELITDELVVDDERLAVQLPRRLRLRHDLRLRGRDSVVAAVRAAGAAADTIRPMTSPIAAAPVSYGVFEMTVGRPGLPDGPALIEAMADAGYAGSRAGTSRVPRPRPRGRRAARRVRHAAGGIVPAAPLQSRRGLRRGHARARERARPAQRGRRGPGSARRAALGRLLRARPLALRRRDRGPSRDVARRAASAAAVRQRPPRGRALSRARLRGVLPPHAGSYIESPREVDALLEQMDTSLLGLCFDTGHSAFGGGEPLALLRHARELVNHVHLKDVDLALLARLKQEGKGLEEIWRPACSVHSAPAARRSTSASLNSSRRGTTAGSSIR